MIFNFSLKYQFKFSFKKNCFPDVTLLISLRKCELTQGSFIFAQKVSILLVSHYTFFVTKRNFFYIAMENLIVHVLKIWFAVIDIF